ncbi:MAG: PadR family transcriptional regulator [Methanomassiliicoccales archaeon]|jgi:DNA-binding PadR family transcriptional regulator
MLVILRKGPMYGYEVLKVLREEFHGFWEPQTGAIYPALKRLEEQKLILSDVKEGKEYYSLTSEGKEWMLESLKSISQEAQFMGRYFSFLGTAAAETVDHSVATQEQIDVVMQLPLHLASLLRDDLTPKERLEMLKQAKNMMNLHLRGIERAIEKYQQMDDADPIKQRLKESIEMVLDDKEKKV